jgi:hypothetical protein
LQRRQTTRGGPALLTRITSASATRIPPPLHLRRQPARVVPSLQLVQRVRFPMLQPQTLAQINQLLSQLRRRSGFRTIQTGSKQLRRLRDHTVRSLVQLERRKEPLDSARN